MTCITSPMSRDEVRAFPISFRTASSSTVRCSSRRRSFPRIRRVYVRLSRCAKSCRRPAMRVLLCSASPRRREFLERLGVGFEVAPAHIDETRREGEPPLAYVLRMAREKAAAVAPKGMVALAADTVVVVGDEVLGKPADRADAERMLRTLSGIEHRVITAVCVPPRERSVETTVRFAKLSDRQIRWLAASGDGDDKAGAYAVQGLAGAFVERIEGSFTNVVGLPLLETLQLLADASVELPWM